MAHSSRSACLATGTIVLAALVWAGPAALVRDAGAAAARQPSVIAANEESADISLPMPKRYAVLQEELGKVRRLYTSGDVLIHPQNPTRSLMIQRVEAEVLVFRESQKGRQRSLRSGRPVPGFPGVTFVGTVMLKQLQYRFKVVDRVTDAEPVLVALTGSQAVLEKEVLRLPPHLLHRASKPTPQRPTQPKLDGELFKQVRAKEVNDNTYEVDQDTLKPVIENVEQVLAELEPTLSPAFSLQTGMRFNFTSRAGDGTLNRSGFTVTRLPVARTFGIEVGDTIISLNSRPVNSPRNAWWTFQELFINNRTLTKLHVNLIRAVRLMTKTYRIR